MDFGNAFVLGRITGGVVVSPRWHAAIYAWGPALGEALPALCTHLPGDRGIVAR